MKLLILLTSLIAALPVRGGSSDDTLKFFLSKSELVVTGKITSQPAEAVFDWGIVHYLCEFGVQEVLKGDGKLKDQVIKVDIERFEIDVKDRHPLIKKDGECILFLKSVAPNTPGWVTADFWFGVQHPSPYLANSLKRVITEK